LPVETLQHIFELACTDGGYTGCSLSLVSTQVRAVSNAARFHSVSLIANPRRLKSFVSLYQRTSDRVQGNKPLLRHLHVAFPAIRREKRAHSERMDARSSSLPSAPSRGRPLPRPPAPYSNPRVLFVSGAQTEFSPVDPTEWPGYLQAARTLFRLAGPDLNSLVVQCGFSVGGHLDLPCLAQPFPLLREVAFLGIQNPRVLLADEAKVSVLFPAATHLYIVPHADDLHLPFWSEHAPGITHLGVSQVQAHVSQVAPAIGVPDEYVQYLRSRPPDVSWNIHGIPVHPPAPPEPEYPGLRRLVMELSPVPRKVCGNGYSDYGVHIAALKDLARKARERGVSAVVVAAPEYSESEWPHEGDCARARRMWIERMEGKTGYWADLPIVFTQRDLPSDICTIEAGKSVQEADSDVEPTDSFLYLNQL
ncbi:hypothetical protein BV20DRAFT_953959, partial [Pilatotrama ljubarskyi]